LEKVTRRKGRTNISNTPITDMYANQKTQKSPGSQETGAFSVTKSGTHSKPKLPPRF
jgi:hypothetical protein